MLFSDGEGVLLSAFHDLLSREGRLDAELGLHVDHKGLRIADELSVSSEHEWTGRCLEPIRIAHLDVRSRSTFSANSAQSSGYFITVLTVVFRVCVSIACPSASHYQSLPSLPPPATTSPTSPQ